ncbi:MAG: hypothetical protein IJ583_15840, partial [Firmicutes bacterium]|nr:hypothetical protein [Bacillota bacterium]
DYFNEFQLELPVKITHDKGHGRIEKREYRLLTEISWLEQKEEWSGLKSLGMVSSTVTEKDKTTEFTRYFAQNKLNLYLSIICDTIKMFGGVCEIFRQINILL